LACTDARLEIDRVHRFEVPSLRRPAAHLWSAEVTRAHPLSKSLGQRITSDRGRRRDRRRPLQQRSRLAARRRRAPVQMPDSSDLNARPCRGVY
jgi:hypothetical protein